jgi:hypothetical protein
LARQSDGKIYDGLREGKDWTTLNKSIKAQTFFQYSGIVIADNNALVCGERCDRL